ncbi:hypothetical protein K504DRAFT_432160 [Pleomassaria siparia CBS 279.74]|uniref:EthD domain-containing protein n=1 Tax=Pleomassaria siparia CBS 279.74 TaxID=1314801 RepID=A0A6G1K9S5_9PLEO|nr:hypothetical protein K504DRAFT_432160 [Pleomassaria siparia CBS 279.74]
MRVSSLLFALVGTAFATGTLFRVPVSTPQPENLSPTIAHRENVPDDHHNYTFQELEPTTNGSIFRQPYFRFLFLFKRKPSVTEAWFNQHWASVHADLTMSLKGTGVSLSRYVQFHQVHPEQLVPLLSHGIVIAPYDGMAEFHAPDIQHVVDFFDIAWGNVELDTDMRSFVDVTAGFQIMGGYDQLIFGAKIHDSAGHDGILSNDPRLKSGY